MVVRGGVSLQYAYSRSLTRLFYRFTDVRPLSPKIIPQLRVSRYHFAAVLRGPCDMGRNRYGRIVRVV